MADPLKGNKAGATPGKLILIGVLAVVLIGVLYIQFSGSDSASSRSARKPESARPAAARRAPAKETVEAAATSEDDTVQQAIDEAVWKSPDLATVVAYDPFALPYRFPQPHIQGTNVRGAEADLGGQGIDAAARAVEQLNKRLEELRQQGVQVILKEQDQYVALIGDQTVHVGDEIDGLTVTEITPSGVRVERKIQE